MNQKVLRYLKITPTFSNLHATTCVSCALQVAEKGLIPRYSPIMDPLSMIATVMGPASLREALVAVR